MLVWVTGSAGVGKSTVCDALRSAGFVAIDADRDGYSHWVHRQTGKQVTDPPFPVPAGWLDNYGWQIDIEMVKRLASDANDQVALLFGSVENESDVWHLFDLVICLVADDQTLVDRLATRDTNPFGKHPEELAAVLKWNQSTEAAYRRLGAAIIDARQPLHEVVDAVRTLVETSTRRIDP